MLPLTPIPQLRILKESNSVLRFWRPLGCHSLECIRGSCQIRTATPLYKRGVINHFTTRAIRTGTGTQTPTITLEALYAFNYIIPAFQRTSTPGRPRTYYFPVKSGKPVHMSFEGNYCVTERNRTSFSGVSVRRSDHIYHSHKCDGTAFKSLVSNDSSHKFLRVKLSCNI